ncbi:hypothetical protein ElyMa_000167000 [Elysia marginata]|uniref:Uncharacterized protein n=1 Tax=Elysia marginata TaxID=1093978 RepID=A0AAV4ET17_9GAST|nr:hypothetical protein ElyMa_000167000 [Elysia marginata]
MERIQDVSPAPPLLLALFHRMTRRRPTFKQPPAGDSDPTCPLAAASPNDSQPITDRQEILILTKSFAVVESVGEKTRTPSDPERAVDIRHEAHVFGVGTFIVKDRSQQRLKKDNNITRHRAKRRSSELIE